MGFSLSSIEEAETEFLALPEEVREVFIAAFRELAAAAGPLCQGTGWYTEELRQRHRIAREGLYSLHVGSLWRGAYYRAGSNLIFIGFGYRLPEFYAKLHRLRGAISSTATRP